MGKYDARLAELVRDEVIARLEGPGGLIAITHKDLWFLSDEGGSSTPLGSIKRISRGEGNTVAVLGAQGTLMEIPLTAFRVDELKGFLESLKEHVIRARSRQTQSSPPPVAAPQPQPQPQPEAKLEARPEAKPQPAQTPPPPPAETAWPEPEPQVPPREPRHPSVIQVPENEPDLPPAAPTQVWEEERARKTAEEARPRVPSLEEPPPPPVPTPVPTMPEPPAAPAPTPSRARSGTGVLLKVLCAITLAYSLAYVALKASDPAADLWTTLGVVVFGLGLAGIQWRLSEIS